MSVLIKGMKMPTGEDEGMLIALYEGKAYIIGTKEAKEAVELLDHGDLIDRETLMCEIADWQLSESPEEGINWQLGKKVTSHEMQYGIYRLLGDVYEEVRDVPAVIPAERSEDETN